MIDFDIYEDSDATNRAAAPRRRSARSATAARREGEPGERRADHAVETVDAARGDAHRAVLAHIGGAKAKLFSAVTPAARRRRRQERRDAAAAQRRDEGARSPR